MKHRKTKKRTNRTRKPDRRRRSPLPAIRFSPTAWAKLLFLRDYGDTEVGGFGIAASTDLLLVQDLQLVKQTCSLVHVAFDDEAVANFFDDQVDAGLRPEQFGRIWIHTHPGACPEPSPTDEATFERVFGRSDWAVMFILARQGRSYARLRMNSGPTFECEIPVRRDYSELFPGCDPECWEEEYLTNVHPEQRQPGRPLSAFDGFDWDADWFSDDPDLEGDLL
ncbi:MPN domain-containing protein [Gimesia benthica]|uniref:hypothetical protein n=1 Tax=Gimesia benthica TaxID=2608982 RepID=UPI001D14D9A5|nr:hypothetical protein [Gimesia benthica]